MISCNRFDQIRARKLPEKMKDRADLLFPLPVYDASNNTKVGEYHTKQEVLVAVDKYKQERKSSKDFSNPLSNILQLYRLFHWYKIVFKDTFFFSLFYQFKSYSLEGICCPLVLSYVFKVMPAFSNFKDLSGT